MSRLRLRSSLAVLCVLMTACGDGQSDDADNVSRTTAGGTSPIEVSAWDPGITVERREFTADQREASRIDQANQVPGGPREAGELPKLVRWIEFDERGAVHAQCRTDAGFPSHDQGGMIVTGSEFGAADGGVSPEQEEAWHRVSADCYGKYPIEPYALQSWGEDQWRIAYRYYTDFYPNCLSHYEIEMDLSDVPSEDVWVSAENPWEMWDPLDWMQGDRYQEFAGVTTNEALEFAENCQQVPPAMILFGD